MIGDKTQFYNVGLEEADMQTYVCPACGVEKDVEEEYDVLQRMFFPVRFSDKDCQCGCSMDRKKN